MAITDVLTEIKNYFLNWHTNNYVTLHTKETNRVTDQSPDKDYLVHSGAIKAADDAIIQGYTTADTNLQNQINDIKNVQLPKKLNSNQTATGQRAKGDSGLQSDYAAGPEEASARGFYHIVNGTRQNGVMTWQDKAVLRGLGDWLERTHSDWGSIHSNVKIWVNPSLRIVYCRFYDKNSTKLKSSTEWSSTLGTDSNYWWHHIRPISSIWGATNVVGVQFGATDDGMIYLRSDRTIAKATITGSLFWFYRDDNMYDKLRTERV